MWCVYLIFQTNIPETSKNESIINGERHGEVKKVEKSEDVAEKSEDVSRLNFELKIAERKMNSFAF